MKNHALGTWGWTLAIFFLGCGDGKAIGPTSSTHTNQNPTAGDDVLVLDEDTQGVLSPLDNDQDADGDSLVLESVTDAQNGVVTIEADTLRYVPAPNFFGADSFTYTINDSRGGTATASVAVTVASVNDPPQATDVTGAVGSEDQSIAFVLTGSDIEDPEAQLQVQLVAEPNSGVLDSAGGNAPLTVTYFPDPDFFGVDQLTFQILDKDGALSATSTVILVVNAVDDPPVVNDITPANLSEDTEAIITLPYFDADGEEASTCTITALTNVTQTTGCSCTAGSCSVGITGTPDYYGSGGFDFSVVVAGVTSNVAHAALTIDPVDEPPVAYALSPGNLAEDVESTIVLSYSDPDGLDATACAVLNLVNVTQTTSCSCSGGSCSVGVTGLSNYSGSASFEYTVSVGGRTSSPALVSLTIDPVDDPPQVVDLAPANLTEDVEAFIALPYSDADGDDATTCTVTALNNVTQTTTCSCTAGVCSVGITGVADFSGSASFQYSVSAAGAPSNSATVNLTIDAKDDAPVAADINPANLTEDKEAVVTLSYTDTENDLATACNLSALTNIIQSTACTCTAGTCTVGVTGTPDYFGAASFQYTVTAGGAISNVATVSLTIDAVDDAPVAASITPANLTEDVESVIVLPYRDTEGDPATACTVTNLTNVSQTTACVCQSGTCSVEITGAPNQSGSASFDFSVEAGGLSSELASATLTIDAVDDPPLANDLSPANLAEDTEAFITLSYSDVDGDAAASCNVSTLTNVAQSTTCSCTSGTCTVGITGTSNYYGPASFQYTVTAAGQASNLATATLFIDAVDDAPVASDLSPANLKEDTEALIALTYSDIENDLATSCNVSTLTNVTQSTACACSSGICTVGVTGTADYFGSASFQYTVTAAGSTSNSASVSLMIDAVDDAPVATAITPAALSEDVEKFIVLPYTDTEADPATLCTVSNLTNVTQTTSCACLAGTCSVGITGSPNFSGAASFDFTVTAGGLLSNVASATLDIEAIDDPPVAVDISPAQFPEDTEAFITLAYTDVENDPATSCSVSALNNVVQSTTCSCSAGACTVGITGSPDYFGTASFKYTVIANGTTSNSATASLAIGSVDDAPVADALTPPNLTEDVEASVSLSYTDKEGDPATSCTLSGLANVGITTACTCVAGACTVGITGTANYSGAASFDYAITAGGQTSNTAHATLFINAVDDAPVAKDITPPSFSEDSEAVIALDYSDVEGDLATSCTVGNLVNVFVSTGCSCTGGSCTVGVTGNADYNGLASFEYTVTAGGKTSGYATAKLDIIPIDDAPVAADISPANLTEDVEGIVTLAYTDVDGDDATSCVVTNLVKVTQTTGCTCTAGLCSTGVTGTSNYNGPASFQFTVTAAGKTSNLATASLIIDAVDDPPVAEDITPPNMTEDIGAIISLTYTDVEGNQAVSCNIGNLIKVSQTSPCVCSSGSCSVGVRGTADSNGAASFTYTVTANGKTSNTATAKLVIDAVDDAPVALAIAPPSFDEDTESIISLDYADVDGDLATSCTVVALTNVTETSPCSCDVAGACTVGITGDPNFFGSASFSFSVTANGKTSATAPASLSIAPVDDAPVAVDDSAATLPSVAITIPVLANDADVDTGDPLTVVAVGSAANGATSFSAGSVTYTPNGGFFGSDSFTYTIQDSAGVMATATVTVAVNTPPTLTNVPGLVRCNEGQPFSFNAVATDFEAPPQTLTFSEGPGSTCNFSAQSVSPTGAISGFCGAAATVCDIEVVVSDGVASVSQMLSVQVFNIWYVVPGGVGLKNGTSWDNAFATPAAALAAASAYDQIWLAEGTYAAPFGLTLKSNVAIYGGFAGTEAYLSERAGGESVLDGQNNADTVITAASNTLLDGVVITGGLANGSTNFADSRGGAIFVPQSFTNVTLRNCELRSNSANFDGGAIYVSTGAQMTIENSRFVDNGNILVVAADYGGAIFVANSASLTLDTVQFVNNFAASDGSAIAAEYGAQVAINRGFFDRNVGANTLFFAYDAKATIQNSRLAGNTGHAVRIYQLNYGAGGSVAFTNTTFDGNTCSGCGGGAAIIAQNIGAPVTMTNCTFVNNFANSNAGAIHTTGSSATYITVANSAFWGNVGLGATDVSGAITVQDSCLTTSILGNIYLDGSTAALGNPFVTAASGERFLNHTTAGQASTSACVDAGNDATANAQFADWVNQTTSTDLILDGPASVNAVDMGRHYDPADAVIWTLTADTTTVSWTTVNAVSCVLTNDNDGVQLVIPPAQLGAGSATHGQASGVTLSLTCEGTNYPVSATALVP